MTGTGSQTDPYIVDSWSEFVSVSDKAVYITCPENSVWDMSEQLPDGLANAVNILANEFNGNGLVIKNLYANGGSLTIGNSHYAIKIKRVSFINLSTSSKNSVIFKSVYSSKHYYGRAFQNCKFTGAITSGTLFSLPGQSNSYVSFMNDGDKSCLFDIFLGEGAIFNAISTTSFMDCYIKLSGHTTTAFTGKYTRCYFTGESPFAGAYGIDSQRITNSILDIVIPQGSCVSITSSNAKKCVINKDKLLGGYYYDQSARYVPIEVTTEQLSDAEYLKSKGFAIATEEPYANDVWRISENINNGKPYTGFMLLPDIVAISLHKVFQNDYITVYDKLSDIENFDTHGLAVLAPTRCEITEEYNGAWTLSIEHPYDNENKWQYIQPFNIIKAMGQLFVIQVVEELYPGYISAKSDHIFYQQNDWWINNTSFIPVPVLITVERALTRIKGYLQKFTGEGQKEYEFYSASDLALPESFINSIRTKQEGMSLGEYIMGDGNVLQSSGGELYRDNFYYSIYKRMEKSNDNAFEIRVGKDLTGIKRVWDVSTMCTYFMGNDNYGNFFAVSWSSSSAAFAAPHGIVRSKNFSFTFPDNLKMSYEEQSEAAMEMLGAEVMKYFGETCAPLVSYEVDIKDVSKNPDFQEFSNMPDYRVGNIGIVYDERIGGSIRLKITKTVKNAITGETLKVCFGDNRSFVGRGYNTAVADLEPQPQSYGWQLSDASHAFLFDSQGNPIMVKRSLV